MHCLIPVIDYYSLEIHSFSDVGDNDFAVVCYVHIIYIGQVTVNFLFGKSRMTLLKPKLTIPKLELVAMCLLVRIVHIMIHELSLPIN